MKTEPEEPICVQFAPTEKDLDRCLDLGARTGKRFERGQTASKLPLHL